MKKVLLIDDDSVFSKIIENASHDYGYEIESVHSFKKFKTRKLDQYDAFLVDYDLLDGTGDQVLEFLKEKNIDRPIAMISSTNHVDDEESSVDFSACNFVSKWQNTNSFFQKLKDVL